MKLEPATRFHDRADNLRQAFDKEIRTRIRPLITDALIEEYRRNPHGEQSDELMRVLNYFRKASIRGKYALLAVEPFRRFRIMELTGRRDQPPRPVSDTIYDNEADADFAVFMLRIADIQTEREAGA